MYNKAMARPIVKDHPGSQNSDKKEWTLKAIDRCDQCSAQAYVMVRGITGELMFCGHHYEKIMNDKEGYNKMMGFMLEIVDEREKLIENKLIGQI